TGRPPFRAAKVMETLMQVIHDEPVPLSRLNSRVPHDLETICLKCLHKEARQRYATAAHLADDLGRFLRREPVQARPVGRAERVVKWARRNPVVAALLAGVMVSLVGGTTVATYFAFDANDKKTAAANANVQLTTANTNLETEKAKVETANTKLTK